MSKRIRVLHVVDSLEVGGVREIVLAQLRRLDPDRFERGLLSLEDDAHLLPSDALPDDVPVFSVAYRSEYGYGVADYLADGYLLRSAKRSGGEAVRTIEGFQPDILHFQTVPRNLGIGILARKRCGAVLVFTDQSLRIRPDEYSPLVRFFLRAAYRRLYRHYHVLSVGLNVEAANRASGFLSLSRRHQVLVNQIDIDTFHPPVEPRGVGPVEIVHVGRIDPVKAHDVLIEAFARIPTDEPLHLTLIGPDSRDGAMQALADQVVAPPREVHFLGARTDVPELLRKASIAGFPSRREGLPLALQEMMASGLPVVASDIPEVLEVVTDGVDALVAPVDDVEAFAAALTRLVEDRELRERMGAAARATAERRMSFSTLEALEAFYVEVTSGG